VYSWGVRIYERRNGTREGRTEIRTKIACGILETKPLSQSVSFRHHVLCDLPLKLSECEWKGVAKICLFIHNSGAIEAIETYIAEDNCPCTETFSSGIPDCNKNRNTPTLKPIHDLPRHFRIRDNENRFRFFTLIQLPRNPRRIRSSLTLPLHPPRINNHRLPISTTHSLADIPPIRQPDSACSTQRGSSYP